MKEDVLGPGFEPGIAGPKPLPYHLVRPKNRRDSGISVTRVHGGRQAAALQSQCA